MVVQVTTHELMHVASNEHVVSQSESLEGHPDSVTEKYRSLTLGAHAQRGLQ